MPSNDIQHLRTAIRLSKDARSRGNLPFGSVLVDADGEVLLEAQNTTVTDEDCTAHAETNLVREACRRFPAERLQGSTLYTSGEPCPMCAGAIYWSGVRRVVYALGSEQAFAAMDRDEHRLALSCRELLSRGGHQVEVVGPFPELEEEALSAFSEA